MTDATPMRAAPEISVVICTHNRASYLRIALASLVTQDVPHQLFEVLVVDNRSTDETPAVVDEFVGKLPIRRIAEPTLGLCYARNTGFRAAAGEYIAYFDDDAVADAGWLMAVRDAFANVDNLGVVGGPVYPIWEAPRPAWLSDIAARALTVIDWPNGAHEIPDVRVEWLAGANMALPKRVLEEIGGFHPGLDRVGHNMLSSGDVYLERQVRDHGYRVWYEPRMSIGHAVTASRLTKDWFRRRYYWQGISDTVIHLIDHDPTPLARLGDALTRARKLATSPQQLRALTALPDDPEAFTEMCMAWISAGQIAGLLGKARR